MLIIKYKSIHSLFYLWISQVIVYLSLNTHMMNRQILFFLSFIVILSAFGCKNTPERPAPILSEERITAANQAATQVISSAAAGIQHYYCANQCEGSGGDAAGTCPVCGTEYTHNQAWHDAQNQNAAAGGTAAGANITQTPTTPEPAQNAAGVWHYTCPNGHSGGSGSATPCGECGTTLVHNQAYHN